MDIEHIKYTMKHRVAFRVVEKKLTGHVSLRGYLHDLDKIFLYLFLDGSKAHNIHRAYSRHHTIKAKTHSDYVQMIIDWECARLTKPDKLLNARQTLATFYPELKDTILPIIEELGL